MVGLLMCNLYFYPRSPCGERQDTVSAQDRQEEFLSTLSLRRATLFLSFRPVVGFHFYPRSPCGERPPSVTPAASRRNFYPRSPCGERQPTAFRTPHHKNISIHALLAESDPNQREIYQKRRSISIHALLAESDGAGSWPRGMILYFYPRSPCGERLSVFYALFMPSQFLSTLSLRRATNQ